MNQRHQKIRDRTPDELDADAAYLEELRRIEETYAGNGQFVLADDRFFDLLCAALQEERNKDYLYEPSTMAYVNLMRARRPLSYAKLVSRLRDLRVWIPDLEKNLDNLPAIPIADDDLGGHQTLTELLAEDIPPPTYLIERLMHDGMLMFGGKSKRGKSWLMFDLALSIATGRSALRHAGFRCATPTPVLYLALEDGKRRLQSRARAIQSNLTTVDTFHLRYNFPPLVEGGTELLARLIEKYGYGLVVIDVLAKLEPVGKRGDKSYHEIYEMFGPIQELRAKHDFCLAMLTHLRKQDAEDVFDAILGSVAYQGAQDVLWVLERKPKDDFAFLHVRDKDAEDMTYAIRFNEGHWEYMGEGESYTVSRDQRKVMNVLEEEKDNHDGLSIQDIQKACGMAGEEKYGYMRKLLFTMVKDDLIHRTKRGRYTATISGSIRLRDEDADDLPDVPL